MKHLVSLYLCCSPGQAEDRARREAERGRGPLPLGRLRKNVPDFSETLEGEKPVSFGPGGARSSGGQRSVQEIPQKDAPAPAFP